MWSLRAESSGPASDQAKIRAMNNVWIAAGYFPLSAHAYRIALFSFYFLAGVVSMLVPL